jgi:hypothetical protein
LLLGIPTNVQESFLSFVVSNFYATVGFFLWLHWFLRFIACGVFEWLLRGLLSDGRSEGPYWLQSGLR